MHRQRALPDQSRDETDFWRPDLPGQRGFNFAKAALDSKVEPVVGDFQKVDLDGLGAFDVVLYLGVLYHMKEPLTCLERLRAVTKEVAVIETEAVHLQARQRGAAAVPRRQLAAHRLRQLVRADDRGAAQPVPAAGFPRSAPWWGPAAAARPRRPSLKMARRLAGIPLPAPSAPSVNYRAVVHAFV